MEQQTKHPLRDRHEHEPIVQQAAPQSATSVDGTAITKPIDGSQYLDVIEEQEYADRRPSAEEQKPRYSYLKNKDQDKEEQQE